MKDSLFRNKQTSNRAFTRLELLACLGAALVLLVLALPGLATTRARTQQAECIDNLRQIGQAIQLWTVDHDNTVPWQVPRSEFGSKPDPGTPNKVGNAWYEFTFLSNLLITPKILVCPSDQTRARNAASSWGTSVRGGIQNSKYQNNATSYTIGLHASPSEPASYLSSDRNLRVDHPSLICGPARINNASALYVSQPVGAAAWTNNLHGLLGNVLTSDGRVTPFSTPEIRSYLGATAEAQADSGIMHLLIP